MKQPFEIGYRLKGLWQPLVQSRAECPIARFSSLADHGRV